MVYLTDEDIKIELLSLLDSLTKFLDQYDLKYSIMSGTMLGAIRHQGFIPWDDDIDVGMKREEYNNLLHILATVNDLPFSVVGVEIGNEDWPFLKICSKSIAVKESSVFNVQKLWIDIFPFDKISKVKIVNLLRRSLGSLFTYKRYMVNEVRNCDHVILKHILYFPVRLISKEKISRCIVKIYNIINRINHNSMLCEDLVWGSKPIPSILFDELVDYTFEGLNVKGFRDYDTYLKCIYGDYMKLPPEDQRINHGIKAWRITDSEK